MKILHLGKFYAPYRGGMETVLQNVAEGLLDRGCEVSVVVAGPDSFDRFETIKSPLRGRPGRLIRSAVLGNLNSQPLAFSLLLQLRREIELFSPDLVHIHLPNPLAAAVWLLLRSISRDSKPALAIWHHADVTRQRLGGHLVRPVSRSLLKDANGICASSKSLLDQSRELSGFEEKVQVIPFGIGSIPWLEVEASRDGPFLFLGRLVPYKGLSVLIDAMIRVPSAELVIVGEGPLRAELQTRINSENLHDRVSLVGRLEQPDLLSLMGRSRALVLPSINTSETFGLVQLEAMAAGLPVIASELPTGVREVGLQGETTLLVPPGDPVPLAEAIRLLDGDAGKRESMGLAGRRRFLSCFSREAMIDKLIPWYESLL